MSSYIELEEYPSRIVHNYCVPWITSISHHTPDVVRLGFNMVPAQGSPFMGYNYVYGSLADVSEKISDFIKDNNLQ